MRHFPSDGDKLDNGLSKAIHGLASGLIVSGAEVTVLSESLASKNSSFKTEVSWENIASEALEKYNNLNLSV
ncbi:MAG: hypothetical protein KME31_01060 [Tolypothrix carrinoi HA7290-LM1]|nr:hypothetical protein [Tolypothrix carrinoi HA7290-LM1]